MDSLTHFIKKKVYTFMYNIINILKVTVLEKFMQRDLTAPLRLWRGLNLNVLTSPLFCAQRSIDPTLHFRGVPINLYVTVGDRNFQSKCQKYFAML